MSVILNWKTAIDLLCPGPPLYCSFCDSAIEPPFIFWITSTGDNIIICGECCSRDRRGLTADMARATSILEGLSAGRDHPTMRMIQ